MSIRIIIIILVVQFLNVNLIAQDMVFKAHYKDWSGKVVLNNNGTYEYTTIMGSMGGGSSSGRYYFPNKRRIVFHSNLQKDSISIIEKLEDNDSLKVIVEDFDGDPFSYIQIVFDDGVDTLIAADISNISYNIDSVPIQIISFHKKEWNHFEIVTTNPLKEELNESGAMVFGSDTLRVFNSGFNSYHVKMLNKTYLRLYEFFENEKFRFRKNKIRIKIDRVHKPRHITFKRGNVSDVW